MKAKTKKGLQITAIVLASLLLLYLLFMILPRPQNYKGDNVMRKEGDLPMLIAHGGGKKEFPDNTLEAFYNAYSVDENAMMESDVSITKDGVIILSHDTTLDRKTNVTGEIADWNYSDLIAQEVDFGYTNPTVDGKLSGERKLFTAEDGLGRSPTDVVYPEGVEPRHERVFLATTLEELFVCFPNNKINVEIKQSGDLGRAALKETLRLIEKHDAFDRTVVASFHGEIYDEFKKLQKQKEVPDCFMYSPQTAGVATFFILNLLQLDGFFNDGICVFQVPMEQYGFSLATKFFVRTAHKHNIAVHYWTVNDKEDMRKLIEIGADGIMTDYPHRLKEVYDEYR